MSTSRFLIALGVILCLVLSPVIALVPADTARAQPGDSAWPMFGQNPQHTGRSPYSGPEAPKLKWSFSTGYYIGYSSPAIGADGTIYVGSFDYKLYAINPNGSQKWSFTTGHQVWSSPAIGADGTIYVGSYDYKLYAINPNGSQKWSFTTGGGVYSSPAIGADGTIYVGSWDNKLYAINPNGSQKWSFTTGGEVWSSPAIGAGGTIYVGSDDYKLYAINPNGSQKWSFTTGDGVDSSPAIGADGTIYVGSYDYRLYAIAGEYDLTISSTAGGSITTPGEGTRTYIAGTVVNLVATPASGYHFVNWAGDVGTIGNVNATTTTITMNGDYSITANFIAQCDLTINSTDGGEVTTPGEGTFTYDQGAGVNLVAEAEGGYRFVKWTSDVATIADVGAVSTTITMNGDYSITANFVAVYNLTTSSTAGGSVTTPSEGTFTYDQGAEVNLVAEAEGGYRFVKWTGDVATIADVGAVSTTITMNDDCSITANFEKCPTVNWTLIGVIIATAVVAAGLVIFFVRRRGRGPADT